MSKPFTLAGYNIAATPHEGYPYPDILDYLSRQSICVTYHGKQKALISVQSSSKELIIGSIRTFTDIDPNNTWINIETGSAVPANEQQKLAATIGEKRPDFREHQFIFTKSGIEPVHTMIVDVSEITILNVERLLRKLFNESSVLVNFRDQVAFVEVTTIPNYDDLSRVLSLACITKIRVTATRKNPDDTGLGKDIFDRQMRSMRARRGVVEFTAQDKSGLNINADFKELVREEARDGLIEIKARDEQNRHVDYTSKNKPLSVDVPRDRPLLSSMMESLARFKLGV
ncbi:MAG: DUF4747 family protein [Myxococcales bacterium]|nr:DUF4747 family protein [Myxococcales bacterium]